MAFRILLAVLIFWAGFAGAARAQWQAEATAALKCFDAGDHLCAYAGLRPLPRQMALSFGADPDLAIRAFTALGDLERMRKSGEEVAPYGAAITVYERTEPRPRAAVIPALLRLANRQFEIARAMKDHGTAFDGAMNVQRARDIADATVSENDPLFIEVLAAVGAAAIFEEKWDRAHVALTDAVARFQRDMLSGARARVPIGQILSQLSIVQEARGERELAVRTMDDALIVLGMSFDRDHDALAEALRVSVGQLSRMGRCEDAQKRYRELEGLRRGSGMGGAEGGLPRCELAR